MASSQQKTNSRRPPRSWYVDALSAVAYLLLAFLLTAGAKRALGPIPALAVLTLTGGLCFFFGRSAWRGVLEARSAPGE